MRLVYSLRCQEFQAFIPEPAQQQNNLTQLEGGQAPPSCPAINSRTTDTDLAAGAAGAGGILRPMHGRVADYQGRQHTPYRVNKGPFGLAKARLKNSYKPFYVRYTHAALWLPCSALPWYNQ